MTTTIPTNIVVPHADHIAALCTPDRVYPVPGVAGLPVGHPDRDHIDVKCLIAGAILSGDIAGPYDDARADDVARMLLARRSDTPRRRLVWPPWRLGRRSRLTGPGR